mmetsp:Transcript_15914/g.26681  ORF Transcript_15914/g.26681 Transcript_15914/m.26681 type:complete len:162 (-) Transcript_15914:46-531(-)
MLHGYTRSKYDQCVYIKRDPETGSVIFAIVYVDDIIFVGNDEAEIDASIEFFASEFRKLTELEKEATPDMNAKSVPLNPTLDYRQQGDNSIAPIHEQVGKLRYLVDRTRPELLFPTSILATGAANPHEVHTKGLKHITRYLIGNPDAKVTLGGLRREIRLF